MYMQSSCLLHSTMGIWYSILWLGSAQFGMVQVDYRQGKVQVGQIEVRLGRSTLTSCTVLYRTLYSTDCTGGSAITVLSPTYSQTFVVLYYQLVCSAITISTQYSIVHPTPTHHHIENYLVTHTRIASTCVRDTPRGGEFSYFTLTLTIQLNRLEHQVSHGNIKS